MRAYEFQARITADDMLKVPDEVAAEVPREQSVRVILLLPDPAEDRAWQHLTAEQFLQGYAERDAIYDELPAG